MSNRVLSLGLLIALLTLMAASAGAAFDPNTDPALIAWYQFEGNAEDSSANALHGIEHGDPDYTEGFYGLALDLDGDGDYIDCGKDPKFDITAEITLAYWIKVRQFDRQWNTVIARGDDSWRSSRADTNMFMEAAVGGTSGNYVYCVTPVDDGQWHHIAAVYDGSTFGIYVDGKLDISEASTGTITISTYNVFIGDNSGATGRFWNGWIDDLRIYDRAFSEAEVKSLMPPKLKALEPKPADGTIGVGVPLLQWTKGDTATFHNVYLGTSPDLTEADLMAARHVMTMYYHVAGLEPGATYYWRVDEVEADGITVYTGDVWSFVAQAMTAYYPDPTDGSNTVSLTPALTWMPGVGAAQHTVYFGDNSEAVGAGAVETDKGTLERAETTFEPGVLDALTTYFWRVDETVSGGGIKAGPVWSFTTALPVDDFESYTDEEGSRIYETWIDGWTNSTGSTVGNVQAPFAEQTVVRSGIQSMPVDYNNINSPFYSEAELEFSPTQDWTAGGIDTLILYVRGRAANDTAPLYVSVEDSAGSAGTVVHPDPAAVTTMTWIEWKLPLSDLAGVNLARVKKLTIGVGDKADPKAGGTGRIYIDDIRLVKP